MVRRKHASHPVRLKDCAHRFTLNILCYAHSVCVHVTNSFAVYKQQTYFKITAINTCSHCFILILVFFKAARRTSTHCIVSM